MGYMRQLYPMNDPIKSIYTNKAREPLTHLYSDHVRKYKELTGKRGEISRCKDEGRFALAGRKMVFPLLALSVRKLDNRSL